MVTLQCTVQCTCTSVRGCGWFHFQSGMARICQYIPFYPPGKPLSFSPANCSFYITVWSNPQYTFLVSLHHTVSGNKGNAVVFNVTNGSYYLKIIYRTAGGVASTRISSSGVAPARLCSSTRCYTRIFLWTKSTLCSTFTVWTLSKFTWFFWVDFISPANCGG